MKVDSGLHMKPLHSLALAFAPAGLALTMAWDPDMAAVALLVCVPMCACVQTYACEFAHMCMCVCEWG